MELKYIGLANRRVLRTVDFERMGVEGIPQASWGRGETLDINDDAADAVMTQLGDEFEKVTSPAMAHSQQPEPSALPEATPSDWPR